MATKNGYRCRVEIELVLLTYNFPKIALTLQIYHMQVLHLVTESNHFTSRKNYRKRKISNCCCQLLISLYVLHFTLQHTCGILNMNATVPLAEQEHPTQHTKYKLSAENECKCRHQS
jgi:hypothetical protein